MYRELLVILALTSVLFALRTAHSHVEFVAERSVPAAWVLKGDVLDSSKLITLTIAVTQENTAEFEVCSHLEASQLTISNIFGTFLTPCMLNTRNISLWIKLPLVWPQVMLVWKPLHRGWSNMEYPSSTSCLPAILSKLKCQLQSRKSCWMSLTVYTLMLRPERLCCVPRMLTLFPQTSSNTLISFLV